MKALLIVAHGSRRAESNDEVRALTEQIREKAGARFGMVEAAFLELAEPSIPDGIECAIRNGAKEVIVLPYFLSAGRHVAKDIPEQVEAKRAEHPGVDIQLAVHLGAADRIAETMLDLV